MLKWKDLIKLPSFAGTEKQCQNPEQMYERMLNVWYPMDLSDESCLYFVPLSIVPKVACKGTVGIVIIDDGVKGDIDFNRFENCLICNTKEAHSLYESVMESFRKQDYYRQAANELINLIVENKNIDEITMFLSHSLNRPVAVLDTSFRFLSKSSAEEIEALVPEEDRDPNGITINRMRMLQKGGMLDKAMSSNSCEIYIVGDLSVYQIPLFIGETKVAFLTLPGSVKAGTNFLPTELIYELPGIANAFSIQIAKSDIFLFNKSTYFPCLISTILEKRETDLESIRNRLKVFNYDLRSNLYLLCVALESDCGCDDNVTTLAKSLQRIFTNSIYLIQDSEIIFLISRSPNDLVSNFEFDIWNSYLRGNGLHAGFTGPFTNLDEVADKQLRETHLALDAGKKIMPMQGLYRFDELQTDAMLSGLSVSDNLSMFRYEPLMRLIKHDSETKNELTLTLREYIKNSKQPQEVCKTLYIHKNTLYKRLDKIKEIMGCDLSDAEIIMRIQLTFHILENQGIL